jgi:hypothetical protein
MTGTAASFRGSRESSGEATCKQRKSRAGINRRAAWGRHDAGLPGRLPGRQGATRMAFRTRTCASWPSASRRYTVAAHSRAARTSPTDSRRSRQPRTTPSGREPCTKGCSKTRRSVATGGNPWDPGSGPLLEIGRLRRRAPFRRHPVAFGSRMPEVRILSPRPTQVRADPFLGIRGGSTARRLSRLGYNPVTNELQSARPRACRREGAASGQSLATSEIRARARAALATGPLLPLAMARS